MRQFYLLASTVLDKATFKKITALYGTVFYQKIKNQQEKREIREMAEFKKELDAQLKKQQQTKLCFLCEEDRQDRNLIAGHVFSKSRILRALGNPLIQLKVQIEPSSIIYSRPIEELEFVSEGRPISLLRAETRYMFCHDHDNKIFEKHDKVSNLFTKEDCILQVYKIVCSRIRDLEADIEFNKKVEKTSSRFALGFIEKKDQVADELKILFEIEKTLREMIKNNDYINFNRKYNLRWKEMEGSLEIAGYAINVLDGIYGITATFPLKKNDTAQTQLTLKFLDCEQKYIPKKELYIDWDSKDLTIKWAENAVLQILAQPVSYTLMNKKWWDDLGGQEKKVFEKILLENRHVSGSTKRNIPYISLIKGK